jgi:hypothetical protein
MEEESSSPMFEILAIIIERHSLFEWIFLFIFFVICQLFIGKWKTVGNLFLSIYGSPADNIFGSLIVGFIGIYGGFAMISTLIIFMVLVVKLISTSLGYVLPPINLMNITIDCSFIWAVIACGYVRSQENYDLITEMAYLKKRLANVEAHEKS